MVSELGTELTAGDVAVVGGVVDGNVTVAGGVPAIYSVESSQVEEAKN